MADVLAELEYLALGSRLKRLAEHLQSEAAVIHESHGLPIQPAQFPLLAALDRYGDLTVTEAVSVIGVSQPAVTRSLSGLVDLGLATTTPSAADRRQKTVSLSPEGRRVVTQMKLTLWPKVEAAARTLCKDLSGGFLDQLRGLETALAERSLTVRVKDSSEVSALKLVEYSDSLAGAFYDINAEWISDMFDLEQTDLDILKHPREAIIDKGGDILFVSIPGFGVVGTCALIPVGDDHFELTKMGVTHEARGMKAGEFLLRATLDRAQALRIKNLFLLTNRKCAAAIHLYEKAGFVHDASIMAQFGARYERCDVAMSYPR